MLTFEEVAVLNRLRCTRWHNPDTEPWTGADWSNAMCGEAGEAANVVKKLRRCETGTSGPADPPEAELRAMLAHEIADVILYAFLLGDHYGVDVEAAVIEKFNIVSERQDFPDRLGVVPVETLQEIRNVLQFDGPEAAYRLLGKLLYEARESRRERQAKTTPIGAPGGQP